MSSINPPASPMSSELPSCEPKAITPVLEPSTDIDFDLSEEKNSTPASPMSSEPPSCEPKAVTPVSESFPDIDVDLSKDKCPNCGNSRMTEERKTGKPCRGVMGVSCDEIRLSRERRAAGINEPELLEEDQEEDQEGESQTDVEQIHWAFAAICIFAFMCFYFSTIARC
ncbi:hypothetical protein AK830_g12427 [Neonectria ditissima]|uniref:Uncharacterized protein n=1 Tax=Neonectria ditissima TaxID=78410 RepID=A0A0P7AK92_9HYPO|nr:hypothetical protein AK830_g12427 [Neonectria ditissima]